MGSTFTGLNPFRILDTRPLSKIGAFSTPLGPHQSGSIMVAGVGQVPGMNTTQPPTAVVVNVTVTNTTTPSFLTVATSPPHLNVVG